jgi:hypothetical protein
MDFQWDEANIGRISRHQVTTDGAEDVFYSDPVWILFHERNGEFRRVIVGSTEAGRILVESPRYHCIPSKPKASHGLRSEGLRHSEETDPHIQERSRRGAGPASAQEASHEGGTSSHSPG